MFVRGNGLDIRAEVSGSGLPVVFLHGFMGSHRAWDRLVPKLTDRYRCVTIDLAGHGESGVSDDWKRYSIEHQLGDILAVIQELNLQDYALVGYSMGGRIALRLALEKPASIRCLILESCSPGIEDEKARAERRAEDDRRARTISTLGMPRFVEEWEGMPLFDSQRDLPDAERQRIREERLAGRPQGIAGTVRAMSPGRQVSVWTQLPKLRLPTLLIAGERDASYKEVARRMGSLIPDSRTEVVAGAGHAVHLERPATVAYLVRGFLDNDDAERIAADDTR